MCFDSCVSSDPVTGSKHIPASARVDPSSLPFHALSGAASEAKVTVTLFHLGTIKSYRQAWADDTWDTDVQSRLEKAKQPVELPVLSALIEHEPTCEKWLWDLGMCNVSRRRGGQLVVVWTSDSGADSLQNTMQDSSVLPKVFSNGSIKFMAPELHDHGQLQNILMKKFNVDSIEKVGLSGIIISHAHIDHYGNLLQYPSSLPVFVGPRTMDWIGGGEDAAVKGEKGLMSFPTSFLKDRTFIEMDQIGSSSSVDEKFKGRIQDVKVGPFDRAWDFFGDGSVIVASAEGVSFYVEKGIQLSSFFLTLKY